MLLERAADLDEGPVNEKTKQRGGGVMAFLRLERKEKDIRARIAARRADRGAAEALPEDLNPAERTSALIDRALGRLKAP